MWKGVIRQKQEANYKEAAPDRDIRRLHNGDAHTLCNTCHVEVDAPSQAKSQPLPCGFLRKKG